METVTLYEVQRAAQLCAEGGGIEGTREILRRPVVIEVQGKEMIAIAYDHSDNTVAVFAKNLDSKYEWTWKVHSAKALRVWKP